jgi:hypothetical protein
MLIQDHSLLAYKILSNIENFLQTHKKDNIINSLDFDFVPNSIKKLFVDLLIICTNILKNKINTITIFEKNQIIHYYIVLLNNNENNDNNFIAKQLVKQNIFYFFLFNYDSEAEPYHQIIEKYKLESQNNNIVCENIIINYFNILIKIIS